MEVFVSPTDLLEKNNFCFLYKITICKVAPLCEKPYSTYRLKETYINMPKKIKTQNLYYIKTSPHQKEHT